MKQETRANQLCRECGQDRVISWTRIYEKSAGGQVVVDFWSGRCPDNHELPQELHS